MDKGSFEGVRVLDFTWALAGPLTVKYLADYGATVVRIESEANLDGMRLRAPYKDSRPGVDRGGYFSYCNANKYSMVLNLSHPEAAEIAKRLVKWADVVAESFTPGVMKRWGLDYENLRKIKPDIIMVSASMQGQTGPYSRHLGWGYQLVALSGFMYITGWPDRGPATPHGAYTDWTVPRFAAAALVAALDYRRRTGKGQYLDVSQFEASMPMLAPLILSYFVNRDVPGRVGNRCSYAAPHGVYPCQGEDRWCAITIFTDEEWKSFCDVIGNPKWSKDSKFDTLLGRKMNEDELDRLVGEWTSNFSPEEVMQRMQANGVPAGVVKDTKDVYEDMQLKHRGYLWAIPDHREMGQLSYLGQAAKLSETPAIPRMPAPCLGEHTELVCREILGMSDDEFTRLLNEGVFT